ncbi:hypothetical protein [uncultured Alistipes sp.]|jgi:tetratricopeptide (TPR) repeat protein|uniref:hypothetical protein n=3 Tax=Alistipes TaxID=239759 RepID=UPI002596ECB3|nr:hypothetical protein [uncultured Alistipes sp.]
MKNILNSLFKKQDNTNDDYVDQLDFSQYLSNEFKFQHQNPQYQLRANPNDKVTLGILLNRIFDISQNEVSDLYIVADNLSEKKGRLIIDQDIIWNFDLCDAILLKDESGEIQYKYGENVVLSVSYRKRMDDDEDQSFGRTNNNILIHLRGCGGGKDTWFIRASIMIPAFPLEDDKTYIRTQNQPQTFTVLLAYDNTNSAQRIAEYHTVYNNAIKKIRAGEPLGEPESWVQHLLMPDGGHDLYWGNKVLREKRYWDAIVYFENVYYTLKELWLKSKLPDDAQVAFYDSCYSIGWCYAELKLYERALFYLEICLLRGNIADKVEYINCLVHSKDVRTMWFILSELQQLSQLKENEFTDEIISYYHFLHRRRGYVLIDMGKLDEAQIEFTKMLEDEVNKEFAQRELEYIKQLKSTQS